MSRMTDTSGIEPIALTRQQAAAFLGLSPSDFSKQMAAGHIPEPTRLNGPRSTPRWSRDELRAWQAQGCPPPQQWTRVWQEMLRAGTWAAPQLVLGGGQS